MSNQPSYNPFYGSVREFQVAFGHTANDKPTVIDTPTAVKRAIWSAEELVEFLHASTNNPEEFAAAIDAFKEGIDNAVVKSSNDAHPTNEKDRIVAQNDALVDELYFNMGSFATSGVDPTPLFNIVQQANMAKLGADGKPIIRPHDNKIMKPEGWQPPEPQIIKEIERQMTNQ